VIGFVAGLVAGISPCILPVLPVVLVAGATRPMAPADTETETDAAPVPIPGAASPAPDSPDAPAPGGDAPGPISTRPVTASATRTVARRTRPVAGARPARSSRAYAVIAGLVLSFSVFTLAGSALLSALGLPQDFLRDAGIVVLGVVAVGLIVPAIGHLLERPFARAARRQPTGGAGAFVLGIGLGAVFVPCAGPVLAAISVVSATHHVGLASVVLTFDFALGAAVPLLVFALAGQRVADRVAAFRSHAVTARRIGGVVLLVMTLLIAFNLTDGLQRVVPGYTSALQRVVEGNSYATHQLAVIKGEADAHGGPASCAPDVPTLENCGPAPAFAGVTQWLNTPGDRPLTIAGLRGQVVLVDFWTYSCINCQRSLPHVESWYAHYHKDGFVVVGVHTPEFAFEHVVSNVVAASKQLGVRYPVAVDDDYKTWNAYQNEDWPAEYLIDATGHLRHVAIGEGNYAATESLIRSLLLVAHPGLQLAKATDLPDTTPMTPLTAESYLGYERLQNFAGTDITENAPAPYTFPSVLPANTLAFSGTWSENAEEATAGADARLELNFEANDVYLVLGGTGSVTVSVSARHTRTVTVSGIPRLYTLVQSPTLESATVVLGFTPGIEAYDFTFG